MLYFSGSGIQIFSLGMIFMLLTQPISAVFNIFQGTFFLAILVQATYTITLFDSIRTFQTDAFVDVSKGSQGRYRRINLRTFNRTYGIIRGLSRADVRINYFNRTNKILIPLQAWR